MPKWEGGAWPCVVVFTVVDVSKHTEELGSPASFSITVEQTTFLMETIVEDLPLNVAAYTPKPGRVPAWPGLRTSV